MNFNDLAPKEIPFFIRNSGCKSLQLQKNQVQRVFVNGKRLRSTREVLGFRRFQALPDWGFTDPEWRRLYRDALAIQTESPRAIVTGTSATILLGLPVKSSSETLELAVPHGSHCLTVPGTQSSMTKNHHSIEVFGLHFHHPLFIVMNLARRLSEAELILALEAFMGSFRSHPAFTHEAALATFARFRNFAGRKKLLQALSRSREHVGSPEETKLRLAIVDAGLPEPIVQHKIWIPELDQFLRPDLAYPRCSIIIEYDGEHHRMDEIQYNLDIERYKYFVKNGWHVIRVTRKTPRGRVLAELAELMNLKLTTAQ